MSTRPRKIHFIANCVYSNHLAGGDIHFLHMAEAALASGYEVHFFGGSALATHLKEWGMPAEVSLTDSKPVELTKVETVTEQLRLLLNYFGRFLRTLGLLKKVQTEDLVYAVTDYWVDTWPALLARASGKAMSLGMDAPSFRQIISKSRPDVTANRLSSIYYWVSQNLSLRLFRFSKSKRIGYVHPAMRSRLLKIGFKEKEIFFISNGMAMKTADRVPAQSKEYDAIWIGRMHVQKGIEDLLETISYLQTEISKFRIVLVGKLEQALKPQIDAMGLGDCVTFSGLVSEDEKFRLFKASRVFLMPSHYESWGIVIAEALVCNTPVVAYELEAYRPIFGDLVKYVPCFDKARFKNAAKEEVLNGRTGRNYLERFDLATFRQNASWDAAGQRFVGMMETLQEASVPATPSRASV